MRNPTPHTTRTVLGVLAVVTALTLIGAPVTHAGVYTVYSCRTPEGEPTGNPLTEWSSSARVPAHTRRLSNCPDGPYSLELLPTVTHPGNGYISTNYWAPADTSIRDYTVWRSADIGDKYKYWENEVIGSDWVRTFECLSTAGCKAVGTTIEPLSPVNVVSSSNRNGLRAIDFVIGCGEADDNTTSCAPARPAGRLSIYRADVTFQDDFEPQLDGEPTGPLVTPGGTLQGVQTVNIAATDRGGGVHQAKAEIDGQVVATTVLDSNGGRCNQPFVVRVPCKLSAKGTLSVDTATLTDGAHQLRLLVTDATGTNTAAWGPVTITAENAICNPVPLSGGAQLSARVVAPNRRGRASAEVTTAYGRRLNLTGTLVGADGGPIANARVCIQAADPLSPTAAQTIGTATTDAGGKYSYPIEPGPSRRYVVIYRLPTGAVSSTVSVNVRATASIRVNRTRLRNGQTAVFRGQLRGLPIPPGGVIVNMQAVREGHWTGFDDPKTTDSEGRFTFKHRFTRTYGTQRYRLRLSIPHQARYPYAKGYSQPITLIVRGR
jgi:hypothetical protein